MLTGTERPRTYVLAFWLDADDYVEAMPIEENHLWGEKGHWLKPFVRLDAQPWFRDFLRSMANFSRGFSAVTDRRFIAGLKRAADLRASGRNGGADVGGLVLVSRRRVGQGFGSPQANARVEAAAIRYVQSLYQERGWRVHSVERDRCGYDLLCTRRGEERHLEVKGTTGSECSFFITAGECRAAEHDPNFALAVVLDELGTPVLREHMGTRCLARFDLQPIAYRATLKARDE